MRFEGDAPTLNELIGSYTESGDLIAAIDMAEVKTYELMRMYPKGVPSGVMFAASTRSIEWLVNLVGSMIVELRSEMESWEKEKTDEQLAMTTAVFRLIRAHAQNVTLEIFQPAKEDDSE